MVESILLYSIICIIATRIVTISFKKYNRKSLGILELQDMDPEGKISLFSIVVCALLCVLYNYFITINAGGELGNDRINYTAYFDGVRAFSNQGLGYIMKAIKWLGGSINTVFYVTTFVAIFITLFAYRLSEEANPSTILILFLSQYVIITFTALKQAYTNAFASVFFVFLLNKRTRSRDVVCIFMILLAIFFHPAGIILIPFYFLFKTEIKKKMVAYFIISLLFLAVFMKPLMNEAAKLINPFFPTLSSHISTYFSEDRTVVRDTSAFAFIKGFPCYFISFLGYRRRKRLRNSINNYDKYLIVATTCSFFYFVGTYSAWFFRFSYLLFLPTFILFGLLMKHENNGTNRVLYKTITYLSMLTISYREIALVYILWKGVW